MRRIIPTLIIVIGFALIYPLQNWLESANPRDPIGDENLYVASGETIKRMSLGLDALVADIYWIRTVQYFGRKFIDSGLPLSSANSKDLQLGLLVPLLNIITTLDPHHLSAYRFGAIFLPERDFQAAVGLLERGVRENPGEWRLYQDLGYMYWQAGDYERAADWYEQGSRIPGAMWWMKDLAGVMRIKGNSRDTARAIYSGYLDSDDENIRTQARLRLAQLQAADELEVINKLLTVFREKVGTCPSTLRQLAPALRERGLRLNQQQIPVDPEGVPYAFTEGQCRAEISLESPVPR